MSEILSTSSNEQPNGEEWKILDSENTDSTQNLPEAPSGEQITETVAKTESEDPEPDTEAMEMLEAAEAADLAETAAINDYYDEHPEELAQDSADNDQTLEAFITDDSLTESEKNQHAAWEAEQVGLFEQEATGQDYDNFAREDFSRLMRSLDNPENEDLETQNHIDAELAVVFSIMSMANELTPTTPRDLFDNIRKACLDAADEATENGKLGQADAYNLQAAVADSVENRCHLYMTETYAAKNQAAEAELDTELSVESSEGDLPGDAIS